MADRYGRDTAGPYVQREELGFRDRRRSLRPPPYLVAALEEMSPAARDLYRRAVRVVLRSRAG